MNDAALARFGRCFVGGKCAYRVLGDGVDVYLQHLVLLSVEHDMGPVLTLLENNLDRRPTK